jgi:lipid-binding SYLF domain-containing protein
MLNKLITILAVLILPLHALDKVNVDRLNASAETLNEMMGAGDKGIPLSLFAKAHCVVVIPGMKKGGFIITGKYGRGFASCRNSRGVGWTGPAGIRVEGGGFGLQVGAAEVDVVMLVMSEKGLRGMLDTKFTLGGEASVAGGPVGRDITAQTDASMRADILSWSRSRGVFGGLSLQGGTLRGDGDVNDALYGNNVSDAQILTGKVKSPKVAARFLSTVRKYGGRREKK